MLSDGSIHDVKLALVIFVSAVVALGTETMPSTHKAHQRILVTGGAGYIGSHTCLSLLEAGYDVTVVDNLVNSKTESLRRVGELSGRPGALSFHKVDLNDVNALDRVLSNGDCCDACIHFAGLKAVGESTRKPLEYYENNVGGTLNLLKAMRKFGIKKLIFSSSATVYGAAEPPITEITPTGAGITNAYGRTKYVIEEMLKDWVDAPEGKDWSVVVLRYFNPVGNHPSGRIGEDPTGPPNNLMPYVAQVAVGRRPFLSVFGNDYPTHDGTGVRDYIHVVDLAEGHLAALNAAQNSGLQVFNLGTGKGYSVLDMVRAMEKACGHEIPYKVVDRRPGDVAVVYADTSKAKLELGWQAKRGLEQMCTDLWAWQSTNPKGFVNEDDDSCQDQG